MQFLPKLYTENQENICLSSVTIVVYLFAEHIGIFSSWLFCKPIYIIQI